MGDYFADHDLKSIQGREQQKAQRALPLLCTDGVGGEVGAGSKTEHETRGGLAPESDQPTLVRPGPLQEEAKNECQPEPEREEEPKVPRLPTPGGHGQFPKDDRDGIHGSSTGIRSAGTPRGTAVYPVALTPATANFLSRINDRLSTLRQIPAVRSSVPNVSGPRSIKRFDLVPRAEPGPGLARQRHTRTAEHRFTDGWRFAARFACLVLGLCGLAAVPPPEADPVCRFPALSGTPIPPPPPGTRRMIEYLERIRAETEQHPEQNVFVSAFLAARLQRRLDAAIAEGNSPRILELRPRLARQLLNAGETRAALRQYQQFQAMVDAASWRLDTRQSADLALQSALCHLRIGEQENCLEGHNPDSCLLPLQGGGIHRETRGARAAMQILLRYLERDPHDLRARWLLNIAFMTTGDYPAKVPPPQLIPPHVFASEHDLGRFPDVAEAVGIAVDDLAGGVITEDFDRDGFLDVMVSSSRLDGPLRFFRNTGNGRFIERTTEAGLTGLTGGLNLLQTDYDNDGWPDVLVLRGAWLGKGGHHPNSLLRNRADGTFEDVTEAAGLLSFHPTQTATWFDFDGDGWLDLFIGNESRPGEVHPCELFRNNRNGTFTECATAVGLAVTGFIKAVVSGDYDNDGRPDLYLSNLEGPNQLFRNEGPDTSRPETRVPWRFKDVTANAGVAEPEHSFPAWFWDFDNDGWLDLFVSGYRYSGVGDIAADYLGLEHSAERPRLYRNLGNGRFADVTQSAGLHRLLLAMGANFGDLDNDGWLDFYVGTGDPDLGTLIPNRMFRNAGGRRFQDVTTSGGFGHLQKGHGVAFADLDNDGDQDVYHVVGGAMEGDHYHHALFRNPGHGNHWVQLHFEGVTANRAAIGARLKVVVETAGGERSIHRVVGSGGSFGASPLRQEVGLGDALSIRAVEIQWPGSGKTQVVRGLSLDQSYRVREGATAPEPLFP